MVTLHLISVMEVLRYDIKSCYAKPYPTNNAKANS